MIGGNDRATSCRRWACLATSDKVRAHHA